MAGLLRSAFRLRACLFHVRVGRPFGTTVSPAAALASSRAAASRAGSTRHLLNQTRRFTVATQEKGDTREQAVPTSQVTKAQMFDWALNKLDTSIRRTGRITKKLLLKIFSDMCRSGNPSTNQALLLLRSCGLLLPELQPDERTELAHTIWSKLKELGVTYDISHYNALLKIYLENEHEFSPTDFLTKMEEANIQPNRVTYQRLIAACCSKGDIAGASNILSFMKSKDLPITESVFSALVTGHARAGDMQNAENILSVMKTTGIQPGPDTYVALLKAYAEKGDIQKIEETLENLREADCYLIDKELMEIIFTLAKSGYPQYVQNILKKMKCDGHYIPDGMNLCLHLITHGLDDTALQVLKLFPQLSLEGSSVERGSFLLHHCVNVNMPTAKLKHICDEMKESSLHSEPLPFVLRCALQSDKAAQAIDLMKIMKEKGLPVKLHYFWPLLALHLREKNLQGTVDVLKVMHEMQVVTDKHTYKQYVLPHFEDTASASHRLQEMGCPIEVDKFSVAQVMYEATDGSLENVVALLSSPNMPPMDVSEFRNSLIFGFKKFKDTDAWSKITELLYKDGRYCQTPSGPTEAVGYFLYNLIDNMSDSEVQAKEEQLRQYFHQLKEMGVKINLNLFRGIQRLLNNCNVPELIKDVALLTNREDNEWNIYRQKILEDLKAEGKSYDNILKRQIRALCLEEDLEKALEVKAQNESGMDVGSYASLIHLCCRHNKAEEAMNLKEELSQKNPSALLSTQKYLALMKVLANSGRVDDAINILKEMKEKNVPIYDGIATSFFHILNGVALQGEVETVTRLHEAIVSQDLLKHNVQLCNPLVTVHLAKDDIPAALEAVLDCYKKYAVHPRFHDVLCKLIEKGHTELLQKAVDFISQERGEMTMLYELFFAFMSTGKYKEAKKIIETNGLRARPTRLQWFAEKCIANNNVEILENLVELTRNLFECDRDDMYYYLLKACKENNDWQKADAVWTKMQDEDVIPRERTLILLADILKSNNQEVPFDVPEAWPHELTQIAPSSLTVEPENLESEIFKLVKEKKGEEALDILLEANKKNIVFHSDVYSCVISNFLSRGFLEKALEVKKIAETHIKGFVLNDAASSFLIITQVRRDYLKDAISTLKKIIENGGVPSSLSVTRLVQALAQKGDLESIRAVEKMVENLHEAINFSSMLFTCNTALAHINNNNPDAAVEYLESLLISGKLDSQIADISFVYRKLIENKLETALEKLDAMAERLANQFGMYRPVTDLFLQYINGERMEDARRLLERCSAISEQKDILNIFLPRVANRRGQVHKIKALLDFVPDLNKGMVSFYLLKCYEYNSDLASAKALYEKLKEENVQPDDLFLKSYAGFLKKMGESVPFTEPPNTFKFYADQLRKKQHEADSSDED